MGTRNKQRRREKAKQRAEEARRRSSRASSGGWGDESRQTESPTVRRVRAALWTLSGLRRSGEPGAAMYALETAEWSTVASEAERQVEWLVARVWNEGWQPAELARHARRHEPRVGRIVALAIAADHGRRDPSSLHPQWAVQAGRIAGGHAEPGWLAALATAEGWRRAIPLLLVVQALTLLTRLGKLPTILPPPGSDPDTWDRDDTPAADDPVLARVRALLAQAESTTFEAEAETFTAKAQELIARHAIDTALLWSKSARPSRPATIRIPIDDPYADQKALLLHIVAGSSRCRAVLHADYALMSVVGFAADVAATEMLYTSLLVQSQAAMQAEAATAPPGARVRGRSFRAAFLQGYAHRIGQRLDDINRSVEDEVETERAALPAADVESLLPALVARREAIDTEIDELFGELKQHSFRRTYDALGWTRGDLAGERAELNPAVRSAARALPGG